MNSFNRSIRRSPALLVLAALACAATAGSAYAAERPDQVRSVKVSFADLNIATPQGAAALYSRIKRAAKTVCGMDFAAVQLRQYHDFKPCYEGAIAAAITKVNSPMLTALHEKSDPAVRTLLTQNQGPSTK